MKNKDSLFIPLLLFLLTSFPVWLPAYPGQDTPPQDPPKALLEGLKPGECLTLEETELVRLINLKRKENNLSILKVAPELYLTAKWHVIDLATNTPHKNHTDARGLACDLHSWSNRGAEMILNALPKNSTSTVSKLVDLSKAWNPSCYTPDHKYAEEMWKKPREVANYKGLAYEIVYWTSAPLSPSMAMYKWENSKVESDMLLELGEWKNSGWAWMGAGVYGNYAVVWLGTQPGKEETVISPCATPAATAVGEAKKP